MDGPILEGDARDAVIHRGSHLQIIACAGSGKTEVVAQRVADLFASGTKPEQVVAFTFTERAADELKNRIRDRTSARLGQLFLGKLNGCFVGTIHAYCHRLLQAHVSGYETHDILDEHRLAAFLSRIATHIGLKGVDPRGKLFEALRIFVRNWEALENEEITLDRLKSPFREVAEGFLYELKRYRFLTYGQVIAQAIQALDDPAVFKDVQSPLRYLIVDEYQDLNPAQETLIRKLAIAPVELCVVGDDDQSIYQWRGSKVDNIVSFDKRYPDVRQSKLTCNRRSRPRIVGTANTFAKGIEGRLPKAMDPHRNGEEPEVVCWRQPTETEEAEVLARTVQRLVKQGFRYRDIAVLVRASTAYARLMEQFEAQAIPVHSAGRTALFKAPDAQLFGRTFAWLANSTWRPEAYGVDPVKDDLESLVHAYARQFRLAANATDEVRRRLAAWKAEVKQPSGPANLIRDFYELLGACGVADWDLSDPVQVARLGSLARCSAILADYESVRRRPHPDTEKGGMKDGPNRGKWYYDWLAFHIQNWALGAFEGFEGEERFTLDAIDLTTVHQSKGLEWLAVFVPSLTEKRFPSSNTGKKDVWHVPLDSDARARYEGTINDERRLFYVAMTRARDWLSLSAHDTPKKRQVPPSPFIQAIAGKKLDCTTSPEIPATPPDRRQDEQDLLSITFSELADYGRCGLAFRLRNLIGFQPPLAPELGYGRAVHHLMRRVGEYTRTHQQPPSPEEVDQMFEEDFFLPVASRAGHAQMSLSAKRLVKRYVADYGQELRRMWAVERPFELHLDGAVISGRADVILEEGDGGPSLILVDYKTSTDGEHDYSQQLRIYADAGRREELNVTSAFVHDLKAGTRESVDIAPERVAETEIKTLETINRIRKRQYTPNPGTRCRSCDVRPLCSHAA